jgi:glycosyltransferase involved in cell wall biosynthesis
MTAPLVSVKMITYNHAPYIAQAIVGVLQQKTNFPFELVIGEDCSTDGTREIVFEYQKKYPEVIRVITSEKNVGMSKNEFRAMKACRGKYIAFCEGDDYWNHPGKLQKQVDYLETHPECGLLFADCDVYHTGLQISKKSYNYSNGYHQLAKLNMEQILFGDMVKWTCTAMIRRNLYDRVVEGDPYLHQSGYFLMGDAQLWAEMTAVADVVYIPETLATYRRLDNSASRSNDQIRHWRFCMSANEMRLYLCKKYKLSDELRKKEEEGLLNATLWLAFHEGNSALAEEVRKKKEIFTLKEWLGYFGAKNTAVNYLCRMALSVLEKLKKDEIKWA